ncbi:TetR family transcriptional regulator [Halocynthiibacter sp. C4]|uniref:TetR family transcriptional regulator n=1 Tax=Halocynthiibacter sp. C4 TaxID=2992758 RepID=UPI00237A6862|nr:TetR family transcriptional regulator [Halocynthiibacter sp. C4]MDE0589980.1 TetR family transcriptional regulator [Halocynthiibacter sp. C4]
MPAVKRKRNADATREDILTAAQKLFTAKGFDGAGMREIAAEAGINVALINRYYGSKHGLYKAVVATVNADEFFGNDMSTFGAHMATVLMGHPLKKEGFDPTLAMLRSASSEESVSVITEALSDLFVKVLADKLREEGYANCGEKAALLLSTILGFDMTRRIFRIDGLGLDHSDTATPLLATSLQAIIDG